MTAPTPDLINTPVTDLDLMIGRSQFFPPVLIERRCDYLHRVGPRRALLETEWLLRDDVFGGPVQLRTSRVDIHADVQGWCPDVPDLERFVSRAHGRAGHVEREEVEREGVYTNSRRLTGLTFGRHRMVARVYDKTAEIMRSKRRGSGTCGAMRPIPTKRSGGSSSSFGARCSTSSTSTTPRRSLTRSRTCGATRRGGG
jgi:hypothetical protein